MIGGMPVLDLTRPSTVRAVARRFGIRSARRLGQHFLVDAGALARIAEAAGAAVGSEILEVGPGLGTLTRALVDRGASVIAVEIDPRCVQALALTLRGRPRVRVVAGDILEVTPAGLGLDPGYRVAGNLPYAITGALLPRLLAADPPPERVVVLVQREVAIRLDAPAGGWSLATLAVRLLADVHRVEDLPPAAFWPPPRVHSSLLVMTPRPAAPARAREAALQLARPAFQARRKQLVSGLAAPLGLPRAAVGRWLETAGIEPTRRPGTLTVGEWLHLAATRPASGGSGPAPLL